MIHHLKKFQLIQCLEDQPVESGWLSRYYRKVVSRSCNLSCTNGIYSIADGNDEKKNRDAIPSILSDALQ